MAAAYAAHPERFIRAIPRPPALPTAGAGPAARTYRAAARAWRMRRFETGASR